MDTQVTTTLLSGGVALIVALLGIAGAIAAQLVATRRAFANSLALFERQNDAQERARTEEARREDARQYAEQRRSAYARVLRAAEDLRRAYSPAEQARRALQELQDEGVNSGNPDDAHAIRVEDARRALREAGDVWARRSQALEEVVDELELLASGDVFRAAGELWAAGTAGPYPEDFPAASEELLAAWFWIEISGYRGRDLNFGDARAAFVDAARRELGMPPDPGRQLPTARPETPA